MIDITTDIEMLDKTTHHTADLLATMPGQLRVIRRNGKVTPYDDSKISIAVTKAFLAVEGSNAAASTRIHETVARLTRQISQTFMRRIALNPTIHIEDIQDQVELELMREGEHLVARSYVLYREERRKLREQQDKQPASAAPLRITLPNGTTTLLDSVRLAALVENACAGLVDVQAALILEDTLRNIYDGIPLVELSKALIMSARTLIENEPNYSYVAARLLLESLQREALSFLGLAQANNTYDMTVLYPQALAHYIEKGIALQRLDPLMQQFDLAKLGYALKPERDLQFTYLGLQTLYDRYFIHEQQVRYELPQVFFMRVAMGLALSETTQREEHAIAFYDLLSSFDFISSTPTLFNAGTTRAQLSSCFLTTVPDDLEHIFLALRDNALLSKFAGGLGNDWTPVRAMGSHIQGTNGKSLGIVPFLNVANATAVAVNQGGKRKGAVCAYLETWHLDIEEFLDLRKNTGDERRRTHDMNTANWIPDLFMQRVFENKEWTLFSPDEVPDLHDLYGDAFVSAYVDYEARARRGEIKNSKALPAVVLWRKMLSLLFETGHPWVTFKDPCNLRSPQQHVGVIHSSNLCTEITLNTSADEVAVCNLGSVNLAQHIAHGQLQHDKLKQTIRTAIRMLDNVIDINYYSIPQAEKSNLRHRPIGMGLMGFQDALYQLGMHYASDAAVDFADQSMEAISYYAIEASSQLAVERGCYASYDGSLWSQGILPIDSIELLRQARGPYLEQDTQQTMDWQALRQRVKQQGMRNSNVLAIAPTATISNICGVSQSIEPTYQNLFVKSNLSGEFTIVNPYLVADLKKLQLWDNVMVNDLKYYNGSVQNIERIPAVLKERYATAFEIDARWLIEAASRRQKWIDQAQSLNLYMAQPSGKKLDIMYRMAWLKGLKTTYYLRTLGASDTEKSTIHTSTLNAVQVDTSGMNACAISDPDCEACQ